MNTSSSLFTPVQVGGQQLANRIVLAPMTRGRASTGGIATELMARYYEQRSSAGLIIAEGTVVSAQATAYSAVPGIYSQEQITSWRPVVAAAKSGGNKMYCQLWHVGRQSHSSMQPDGLPPKAPSAVAITSATYRTEVGRVPYEVPRVLSEADIRDVVNSFGQAAQNAMLAGFDGVEIHGANGYLVEQFLNDGVNLRTDKYGGSITNRMRFLEEVLQAVFEHVPSYRVGVRLSPSSSWMDAIDSDKRALFTAVIQRLNELDVAYLHLVEPGIAGAGSAETRGDEVPTSYYSALFDGPVIVTGGLTFESAQDLIDTGVADLVGFGRLFIANPDLPQRFATGAPLQEVVKGTVYASGAHGYTDYPSLEG
ncbi:alkene reductase [Pseudoglutamicibacter albus]|uniref:N-ethylmaleimide reductase n=1 Tax=Pseudoglutamicibacter albus TaxID=98671 RepID=A0ABU1YX86_9MICC|nr:alkene reductase [Pseudoglutamicibacter albus]MDR7292838.1 N-ethylmaleimide reductase [Pseudoglutamicibacter albus]